MKLQDILGDKKLHAALLKFAVREHNDENVLFLTAKGNNEGLYGRFISPKGDKQVNLPSKIANELHALAKAGNYKGMDKGLKDAKVNIAKLVQSDMLPRFESSKEYKEYVAATKMGSPAKAAKLLGIKDVKSLTEAMISAAIGERKVALKQLAALQKKEKLAEDAEALLKGLEKAGLC